LPEDLIWRFALKLEFGDYLNKVAEDAVRLVQRMSLDWMVMGRRPSGVCGACLILAARMNNFRRSITEVVYIVKVTTHTIQKRLDEFKMTPSSTLSVEDFLNNEFLESSHDPPSFYEKSAEFQKNRKRRKRKRPLSPEEDEGNSGSDAGDDSNKRQKSTPAPEPELRRDAEGFAIPPQPTPQPAPQPMQSRDFAIDPALIDSAIEGQSGDTEIEDQSGMSFNQLIQQFGDAPLPEEDYDVPSPTSPGPARKGRKPNQGIRVPAEWSMAEDEMSAEIEEMISDPNTIHHAASYAEAKKRAAAHMIIAAQTNPPKFVSMDVHVGEDEFADDPEVLNCVLPPAEVAKKEKVWVNDNKNWLRKQQIKEWQKRQAENGPPKAKRNRKKKPRIGEGQTSAASSPAEAALNVMKQRSFSKKINYDAIKDMFRDTERMGSRLGSATTSRVTSRAGSDFNGSVASGSVAGSEAGDDESQIAGSEPATPRPTTPAQAIRDDDEEGDEDDYVSPPASAARRAPAVVEEEEEEDWRVNVANRGTNDDEDAALDRLDRMDEDVSDYGSVDAGGLGDDVSVGGYGGGEDEDSGEDE
jgi:transcription factor IIIB subunit 2